MLEALPIGVTVVDPDQRIVLVNPAYCASLDLPPNSFPPGMPLAQALRASAYRGMYGPGDPEELAAEAMAMDRNRLGRLRRRIHNGRSYDLITAPLPDGGHVACAVETTALVAARAEAETGLARVTSALATWRAGFAVFQPDSSLVFSNVRFAEMLGLPPDRVQVGMTLNAMLDLLASREGFVGPGWRRVHRRAAHAGPRAAQRGAAAAQQRPGRVDRLRSAAGWRLDHHAGRHHAARHHGG